MSPTLPPAQIFPKRTNDLLSRLVSTIPSSAILENKWPRHTVWCMKVGPSLNAGRFILARMARFFTLTGKSKPQRPAWMP